MAFNADRVNEAAFDMAKVSMIEREIQLSDHDLEMVRWGVSCGVLAALEAVNANFHVYNK